jgi:hypothetical protein
MQSMKGATRILGSMNRSMNLPALQRIAMEFERENDIMDQRQEMMDDAIDDITGVDEEEESDLVVEQVLEEIGVDLRQAVSVPQAKNKKICGTDIPFRWERHLKACKPVPLQRVKLHRQSEEEVVIQETVIFKPGLIVFGVEGTGIGLSRFWVIFSIDGSLYSSGWRCIVDIVACRKDRLLHQTAGLLFPQG